MKRYVRRTSVCISVAMVSITTSIATFAQSSASEDHPESETRASQTAPVAATPPPPATSPAAEQPASAGPSPATATPLPKAQLATQAPAPTAVTERTDKLHDGFYMRVSLGFASQWATLDDGTRLPNYSAKGNTMVVDLMVGGAPSPGIILGGALLLDSLPSTKFEADQYSTKTGLMLTTLGPFIDGYPNPRGGFHSGGMLGLSAAHLTANNAFATEGAYGFGLATWLGYDCWVADQWAVGGLLRFAGAHGIGSKGTSELGISTRSISLLLTAVYQ